MKAIFAALVFLALTATHALAQHPCDHFRSSTTTGAQSITEKVPAVAGQSIYLCGFVLITGTGQAPSFQLLTGTGTNCSQNQKVLLSTIQMPANQILVNRIPVAAGEFTPPGYAVCLQVTGSGTISSIWYWAQF